MFWSHRHKMPAHGPRRRGVVAVYTMVLMIMMLGFAALSVDVGVMYNTRADLQDAADAAALASAAAYTSDAMMQLRMDNGGAFAGIAFSASDLADSFAGSNSTLGVSNMLIDAGDHTLGWLDPTSATATVQTAGLPEDYNAIQVVVKRTAGSSNGAVGALFSRVFGVSELNVAATAVAIYDDRAAGYDSNGPGALLPFTIDETVFDDYFDNGPDAFEFDPSTGGVSGGSDGVREVKLYPQDPTPGNFGLLNIGTPNMGTPALRDHIDNGVSPDDFVAEIGTAQVTFYDSDGDPVTYDISGNPGLKVALQANIQNRVGQVVGFFLHNQVTGTGANTVYTISQIRFGRVMYVKLTGGNKSFWIQPVSRADSGVILSQMAPSSKGLVGRIVLAR